MYRKRLKNVYDLLESGNNKKVIQEVDKLVSGGSHGVKKKPLVSEAGVAGYDEETTLIIAKSLKCLALVRTDQRVEADKLLDELLSEGTADENALSIISQYCKETQQVPKMVKFYEKAVLVSNDEELLTSLFYAYVKNGDFSKQQQLALKMYKQTGKTVFCFWNAASYVLMSKLDTVSAQQRGLYLQLSEKILEKAFEENKMDFNGEFLLYLNILEARNKFTEALRIIQNPKLEEHWSKFGQVNFKFKKLVLYNTKMANWSNVQELCESFFLNSNLTNLEDWQAYLDYFNAIGHILLEKKESSLIEHVLDILHRLKHAVGDEKVQGPYLAKIEFFNQIFKLDLNLEKNLYDQTVRNSFKDYISLYSSKPGFFYEIIKFNDLIKIFEMQEFILGLLKESHDENIPFKSVRSIYACLSYWQVHRFFGKQAAMARDELAALASQCEAFYSDGLKFGKDLLTTAFQYSDEFLILAVHVYYDLGNDLTNLIKIISKLKCALAQSPSNFQFKLLLLNLYSQVGAFEPLKKMYDSMEIKNIQNYSTANLILFQNVRLGSLENSVCSYATMNGFFTTGLFDVFSFMVNCFKYGTFLKLFELNEFVASIKRSLSINIGLTNFMSVQLMLDQDDDFQGLKHKIENYCKEMLASSSLIDKHGLIPPENEILLVDHTDKDILYDWNPFTDRAKSQNNYMNTIKEQSRLLKLRMLMIRFVNECLAEGSIEIYGQELMKFDYNVVEEVKDLDLKIYNTKSNYLKRFSQLNLDNLINLFVGLSSDLLKFERFFEQEIEKLMNYKSDFEKQCDLIRQSYEDLVRVKSVGDNIEMLSCSLESISFVIVILTSCLSTEYFRPIWAERCKKSKKKKASFLKYAQASDLLYEIYETLVQLTADFVASLNEVPSTFGEEESRVELLTEIQNSFNKSFEELKRVFGLKLKFLQKFSNNSVVKMPLIEQLKV